MTAPANRGEPDLAPIKSFIRERCGLRLEKERAAALRDGVRARMALRGMKTDAEYFACLTGDIDELHCLINLLTVNETYFFREPVHLELLTDKLLPEMLAGRTPGHPVRIFCAGCSTGEEPYSVMMKLMEKYGPGIGGFVSIIAADIDSSALGRAEQGIYGGLSFREFPKPLRAKYFEPAGTGRCRIRDFVKEKVRYRRFNLKSAAYPDELREMDVIFYRNVSIYFDPETQRSIFDKLAGLLRDRGWLFVSSTETLSHNHDALSLVELDGSFCYRKAVGPPPGDRKKKGPTGRVPRAPGAGPTTSRVAAFGRSKERKPENHSPARQEKPRERAARELFDEALSLANNKEYEKALERLDALQKEDPSFNGTQMLKAGVLINRKRFEEAEQVCLQSISRDRWCLEGHLLLGLIAKIRSDNETAARRFREALYIQSSCWTAHYHLAEIHCAAGDLKTARREYEIVIRLLEKGGPGSHGHTVFPLAFPAEQIKHLCRRNLEKLKAGELREQATEKPEH